MLLGSCRSAAYTSPAGPEPIASTQGCSSFGGPNSWTGSQTDDWALTGTVAMWQHATKRRKAMSPILINSFMSRTKGMLLETFPRINERICPSEHMTDRGKDYIVREALSRNTRDEIKRNESPYKKPPPSEGRRLLSHTTIRVNQVLSHRPSTCCRCGGIPWLSTVGT